MYNSWHIKNDIPNYWQPDCLFNSFFRHATNKPSKRQIPGHKWSETSGAWCIPLTKRQESGKHFHAMTSSWCTVDIKNNAWVTVNNDFWVTSEAICQWFSRVTKSRVKSFANRITSDPKIVIHGNKCIILFLTRYFMSWTHNSDKNNHRSLISQLSPRTVVSDLSLWRHHSGCVTSREREILALWRHICRLFLHAQIGANAIFTSE